MALASLRPLPALVALLACGSTPAPAAPPEPSGPSTRWTFDGDAADALPEGFETALTGGGPPGRWQVVADPVNPANQALAQLDATPVDEAYPMAVATTPPLKDVLLSVQCLPLAGRVDQACGLVFRWKDANNYYVTRANPLEGNVRLYHVKDGVRKQIATWSGTVVSGVWNDLAVAVRGDHVEVWWNAQRVIDHRDATFPEAGRVGVWTKADSVTYFDDLVVAPVAP